MRETLSRIENYFRFSKKESVQLLATALVAAFSLTLASGWGFFNVTGGEGLPSYFSNLILIFFIILFALFFHISVQKIIAIRLGYVGEYTYWKNGFLLSIFLSVLTFGFLPLFFTGSMKFEVEKKIRMGRFRYGVMNKDIGWISFSGPFFSVLFAAVLGFMYVISGQGTLIYALIIANLLCAIYSLIPIPVFEGIKQFKGGTPGLFLFIASRWVYVSTAAFVLIYSLLVFIAQIFSLVIALIIGIMVGCIYYATQESL